MTSRVGGPRDALPKSAYEGTYVEYPLRRFVVAVVEELRGDVRVEKGVRLALELEQLPAGGALRRLGARARGGRGSVGERDLLAIGVGDAEAREESVAPQRFCALRTKSSRHLAISIWCRAGTSARFAPTRFLKIAANLRF